MKLINKVIERIRLREIQMKEQRVQEDFQIAEHNGAVWLTFADCPILPCSMLKDAPIDALLKIRELHIKSEPNKKVTD